MTEIVRQSTKSRSVRGAAILSAVGVAVGVTGALAGPAEAAPIYSKPTTLCSADVGDPFVPATKAVKVAINQSYRVLPGAPYREAPVRGKATFSVQGPPPALILVGYEQTVRFDWKNLTTRKSGSVTSSTQVTPDGSLVVARDVATGVGRIQVTAHVTNAGKGSGSAAFAKKGSCTGKPFGIR